MLLNPFPNSYAQSWEEVCLGVLSGGQKPFNRSPCDVAFLPLSVPHPLPQTLHVPYGRCVPWKECLKLGDRRVFTVRGMRVVLGEHTLHFCGSPASGLDPCIIDAKSLTWPLQVPHSKTFNAKPWTCSNYSTSPTLNPKPLSPYTPKLLNPKTPKPINP